MSQSISRTVNALTTLGMALGITLGFATTAGAVDGVIEINSTKASVGGVTGGDAAGYPVTISSPGSYVLTSNLRATLSSGTSFIQVLADDVTINLNGFTLACVTLQVSGPAIPCTFSSGNGIDASERRGLTVLNGTVKWMGNDGIVASDNARIHGVHLVGNAGDGAFLGQASVIVETEAGWNGESGLRVSGGSTISQSAIHNNEKGIVGVGGVHVAQSAIYANSGYGISSTNGGRIGIGMNTLWGNNGAGAETDGLVTQIGQNQCGNVLCP